ncbi:MAG: hypothetical protein R6V46_19325 [Desulfatiglandaceae bacterium]
MRRPRPECFWRPVDALALAERLVGQYCSEDSDAEEMQLNTASASLEVA